MHATRPITDPTYHAVADIRHSSHLTSVTDAIQIHILLLTRSPLSLLHTHSHHHVVVGFGVAERLIGRCHTAGGLIWDFWQHQFGYMDLFAGMWCHVIQ